jgi:hypothetical protein
MATTSIGLQATSITKIHAGHVDSLRHGKGVQSPVRLTLLQDDTRPAGRARRRLELIRVLRAIFSNSRVGTGI